MSRIILVINDTEDMGVSYTPFFHQFGKVVNDPELIEEADLIVFTGGSDVQPSLYNENKHRYCYCDPERDAHEVELFTKAKGKIPMFGICRGAQFLCVMAGGKLVQHVWGHQAPHQIVMKNGRRLWVSSAHHQMMIPTEDDNVLAWADPKLSKGYLNGNGEEINYIREVEVVEFSSIKAIGVQYHPEVMDSHTDGFRYSRELVGKLI